MAFNVHNQADKKEEFNLIPKGYRLWVEITHRGMKVGNDSGRRYADLELTVLPGQPFAGKKLWTIIGDPFDAQLAHDIAQSAGDAKEKLLNNQKMALSALGRILEAAGVATPDKPESYNFSSADQQGRPMFHEIHGLRVPVLIGVQTDKDERFPPKNRVNAWLSPNKNRTDYKHYEAATKGEFAPGGPGNPVPQAAAAPAQAGFGFGAQQAAPVAAPATLGGPPGGAPIVAGPAVQFSPPQPFSPFVAQQQVPGAPTPAAQGWPGQPGRAG